jgi:ATP-dependent protease ClpP protease subunit
LRIQSPGPISAFIDSEGGDIPPADQIRNLLKTPNQEGATCNVITVVTGVAASAAADFLALGDYAIAYPHATVVYHGSRQQSRAALTYEGATSLASSLRQTNERFARRLAQRIFKRFVIRMAQFTDEFKAYRESDSVNRRARMDNLVEALKGKFSGNERMLLREALKKQHDISQLSASIVSKLKTLKLAVYSDSQFEAAFLKAIIDFKVKTHKSERWLISRKGLAEISDDFTLLHDYYYGSQNRDLIVQIETFGELFLTDAEGATFQALTVPDNEKLEWLKSNALPKMQPIWYFIISLCRLLQTADYVFDADEAYWIGLIDEICGSSLPNLRVAANAAATVSPTASSQPPSQSPAADLPKGS